MICVYLLRSLRDKKKYIGSTGSLGVRVKQHNNGRVTSTKYRRPFVLVGYQPCESFEEAARLEKRYKRSHDALKRAIRNDKFNLVRSSIRKQP